MAFSTFTITFNEVPVVDEVLEIYESTSDTSLLMTFKTNRNAAYQVKIPSAIDVGIDTPVYVYSGYVSLNYYNAFNLDYNSGSNYTVTYTTGASGSGIGTVTVTANFLNAEFSEVQTPADTTVLITNEAPVDVPIQITDVTFSMADEDPCDNVNVTVTTNVLATEVTSPVTINPNAENPFTFSYARGETISIDVIDANANEYSLPATTPPFLNEDAFTVTTTLTIDGYITTITNTLPAGLTLEYSANASPFQTDNTFLNVGLGLNNVIIRDNYGCFISIDFTIEQEVLTVLARSTFSLRTTTNDLFDSAQLQLYIWNGNVLNVPLTPTYALSKPVVQLGQTSINFDINQLLKEYIKPQISNYQLAGVQPTPYDLTCWAKYFVNCYNGEEPVTENIGTILACYGYGFFSEGYNPSLQSRVLITGDKHNYYQDTDSRLYFITDKLTTLTINDTEVPITANNELNSEYIQSINLNDYTTENDKIIVEFDYNGLEQRTITYDVLCEIKYEVVNCVFINKYGMPQSFFFTKVKKVTDEIESDNYRGLQSAFGVYNTTKFQYKEFNKNGRTKITLNTNNLSENQNEVIKELLYSEYIWLIESDTIYPVTIESKSVAYKTSLNEKQIQYTMDFKYAFDTINTVQ